MKRLFANAAIAASLLAAGPAAAQAYNNWNAQEFWRGAPSDAWQRMDFLQQRIDRGRSDGSLTVSEAQRAQRQLRRVRNQAWRMRRRDGHLTAADATWLQGRLDTVSREIRWLRHDGVGHGDRARFATTYDAARHYRARYDRGRRLAAADQVYRGSDGRYYCKRSDGTIGLVVGGAAGALLGNVIDGGSNRLAGTLIGGALGALAGRSIDQNADVRCR